MARRDDAAIGFRAHTGWAAVVVIGGSPAEPRVQDRRRIELTDETDLENIQVYHAAAEQPFAKAEWMIDAALAATTTRARASVAALVESLAVPAGCAGLVAGNTQLPASLEKLLASHALIHAAEGEMFRAAIVAACKACKLPITGFAGNALSDHAKQTLGLSPGKLRDRLAALGQGLGSPWGQDQKEAALVAWMALAMR
jgi:hypothetical protein